MLSLYYALSNRLSALSSYAPLALRIVLGILFFAHGAQKLFGWFDGPGFEGTAAGFENGLGLSPGWFHAALGGGGEFMGGILVFFGLFTRFGAFLIASCMMVAIFVAHWQGGLFAANDGFEYPLTLLAAAVSLMLTGGQALSLDSVLDQPKASASKEAVSV
jgi:putative oxidoreductase